MGRRGGHGYGLTADKEATCKLLPRGKQHIGIHTKKKLAVLVLLDFVLCLSMIFGAKFQSFNKFFSEDIVNYNIHLSLFDILILCIIRSFVSIFCYVKFSIFYFLRWVVSFCCIVLIGKALVFNGWSDVWSTTILIVSILCTIVEVWFISRILEPIPLEGDLEEARKEKLSAVQFLRILRPYFWPRGRLNKLRVFLTWVALGISRFLNLMAPLMMAKAINSLAPHSIPFLYIGGYCLFNFGTTVFKEVQNLIYLKVKQTAYAEVSEMTFTHLMSLSYEWHIKKKMGVVTRSMDRGVGAADTVVNWLIMRLGPTIVECFIVLVIFFERFKLPELSAVIFISIISYIIVTIHITTWRKKFRLKTNKFDNAFHDIATDALINYETVKYFSNEDYEVERYTAGVRQYQRFSVSTQASLSLLNCLQALISRSAMLICMLVAGYNVAYRNLNIGDFVAVNLYVLQLFQPLNFLGSIYGLIVQSFIDMENLSELLAKEPDVLDAPNAEALCVDTDHHGIDISFRDVFFHYPTAKTESGLKGISFEVLHGTTTAVVGPTGAGKSTISRLLFRFYDLDSGSIILNNENIAYVTQKSLRNIIGVVPQDTVLFNDTILHNLRYGKTDATLEEIEKACRAAQIYEFVMRQPDKWESKVGERGLKLSGGEKQRIAIARVLLKNPPVLVLDEATSALDSITEKEIQEALANLSKGRTTITIAHRLSTIMSSEQIIVLEEGRIIQKGLHSELLAEEGEYKKMWEIQLQEQHETKKKNK